MMLSPFLKWAGGKRWFVNNFHSILPLKFDRYIEPFLGGGAVFFHLNPPKAILGDTNKELIDTYKAIRDYWKLVYRYLSTHHKNHSKDYYYLIRNSTPRSIASKAAKFIYLNRTCWNGLYRVNLKGIFNVPKGTKDKVLLDTDNFEAIANLLSKVVLVNDDFEKAIDRAKENDFIFIDPPYTIKHSNNSFIKYNENLFTWTDQLRLAKAIKKASNKGAKIILTNADHISIRYLYKKDFEIFAVKRNSVIAAQPEFRSNCKELIIRSKNVLS